MGEIWSALYADSNAGWVGRGVTVNVGGGMGLGVNDGVTTNGIGPGLATLEPLELHRTHLRSEYIQ
jgi:hypothetical protein